MVLECGDCGQPESVAHVVRQVKHALADVEQPALSTTPIAPASNHEDAEGWPVRRVPELAEEGLQEGLPRL